MYERIESVRIQIDKLYNQFQHAKDLKDAELILASLYTLIDLYVTIGGEDFISDRKLSRISPYYFGTTAEIINKKANAFINNFNENKKFHNEFVKNILKETEEKYDESCKLNDSESKYRYHTDSELIDIMFDYFDKCNPKGGETFNKLIAEHKLFTLRENLNMSFGIASGLTVMDLKNNEYFVTRTKSQGNIIDMGTVVHEIGHIEDMKSLYEKNRKQYKDYVTYSVFQEVNSLYREKEFYKYLIDNNIYKEEVEENFFREFEFVYEELLNLTVLTKLPDKYLKSRKYNNIGDKDIVKIFNLQSDEIYKIESDDKELFMTLDLRSSLLYSYGEVLASYFLENPDIYDNFKWERAGLFDKSLLEKLDITSDKCTKVLLKNLKKK